MRILVLTGAGVSAESGIPTFRGKDGYWRNVDPTKLATPEAFARDPELVWEWYRERQQRIRSARPNAAHEAIARLAGHANEFLLVTQNVDDLHMRGGIPAEKMVQIHGNIFVARCSRCEWRAQRCDDALRTLDLRIAQTENAMDQLYDMLRPGADRQANRRTRAAAMEVGKRRLAAVKDALVSAGIAEQRVRQTNPVYAPGDSDEGGMVVITLVPKKK